MGQEAELFSVRSGIVLWRSVRGIVLAIQSEYEEHLGKFHIMMDEMQGKIDHVGVWAKNEGEMAQRDG